MFIAIKTDDGRIKGKISFYCKALKVSRQAFNNYLKTKDAPWKSKADKEARKSDDLIKRNFTAEKPLEKCVTDMTEIKASDGKLYISAIFDCYDLAVLGLAMDTNMKVSQFLLI